jgi:hypothetical protein
VKRVNSRIDQAIFQVKATVENSIGQAEVHKEKLDLLIRLKQLKEKRLAGQKLTADEVKEVLKILCWKDLAGCCAPEKECPWHLAVCEVLGIDPAKLYEAKRKIVEDFI